MILLWISHTFPAARDAAAVKANADFPPDMASIVSLNLVQTLRWLNHLGWTINLAVAAIFLLTCATGMTSDLRSIKIYYASASARLG